MSLPSIIQRIADVLSVKSSQVEAAVKLLDEGATVPFIARYRKEATEALDDTQLRLLEERLGYLRELDDRRETVLKTIKEQNKLSPELKQAILAADNKTTLEDLYRPYMPKRRTKAQIAREAGLEPLAQTIFQERPMDLMTLSEQFLNSEHEINDSAAALEGARQILIEQFSEDAELSAKLRESLWDHALLQSIGVEDSKGDKEKFSDYFEYAEALNKIPSHRVLALFRGRNEDCLRLDMVLANEDGTYTPSNQASTCVLDCARHFNIADSDEATEKWLFDTVQKAWRIRLSSRLETELKLRLKEQAESEAIRVFSKNLKDLLMAAPAGSKVTMGLDPGFRTGIKVAIVDETGKLLAFDTLFPHAPQKQWARSLAALKQFCDQHKVQLISIGNGTASRETERLVKELLQLEKSKMQYVVVSEAGASVYSASQLAANEFPDLDVSYRGAVSIARRLQDPLAELVKIEPKAIGVGQYQHDVNQTQLARMLDTVIEDCVNSVGVDLNTASAALLKRVAGLNQTMADNIVRFRDQSGKFRNRKSLLKVPRLGDKAFEQAAGFLRIMDGDNPLDASAVHPETYDLVKLISEETKTELAELIGNSSLLKKLNAKQFSNERFGVLTIQDIFAELDKPGRDPRPEFQTVQYQEGLEKIEDLKNDMILEGVVSNVTNFGAFVDIGVHQDGLVHISQLADQFVKDPSTVVKTGQIVKVKVMGVDVKRKRIELSMRLNESSEKASTPNPQAKTRAKPIKSKGKPEAANQSAFAMAFANARKP